MSGTNLTELVNDAALNHYIIESLAAQETTPRALPKVDRLSDSDIESWVNLFRTESRNFVNAHQKNEISDYEYYDLLEETINEAVSSVSAYPTKRTSTGESLLKVSHLMKVIPKGYSKNSWKKAVRFLARMTERSQRILSSIKDREAFIEGLSLLSHYVDEENLTDPASRAYVTYMTGALQNKRGFVNSELTAEEAAVEKMLFADLQSDANWFEIVKVRPSPEAMENLSHEDRVLFLCEFRNRMEAHARTLQSMNAELYDRETQLNTYKWNIHARAFNCMRAEWVKLMVFMGYEDKLEGSITGDVPMFLEPHLHYTNQKQVDRFKALPTPWEIIFDGETISMDSLPPHLTPTESMVRAKEPTSQRMFVLYSNPESEMLQRIIL